MFEVERSHAWRTTLHTLYGRAVPTAVLDSQLGNSKDARAKHYTGASDLSALSEAVQGLSEQLLLATHKTAHKGVYRGVPSEPERPCARPPLPRESAETRMISRVSSK